MESSLISTEKLKKRGYIHQNVEDSILRTLIIRVQDSIVEPILGTTFFKRLIQGIIDDDLTADEIDLMNDYVIPVMVSGCDYRSVNVITYEIRNKAVGSTQDEHLKPVSESENVRLKDDLKADLDLYRNRLIGFLKDNCTLFTEYNNWICSFENIAPIKKTEGFNISIL